MNFVTGATGFVGRALYEAEQSLLALAKEKVMEVFIICSQLIYGPGVDSFWNNQAVVGPESARFSH